MLIKKFSLNQLTIRTFTVFWLAFFAMTALLVALPYFDSRLYSDLNQNEISSYQKKLVESIRNNRINGILAGVPVLPTDKFDSARPVSFVQFHSRHVVGKRRLQARADFDTVDAALFIL